MGLTHEELRAVLARADEIQRASTDGAEHKAELESVIAAAEEVGLARPHVERALRERSLLPATPPSVGALIFARAADDRFYVAEVLTVSAEGVRVRFLRGSEHLVTPDQIRPCSLIPGERVACEWPMWGTWTCTIIAYDAARKRVKLSDGWGYTRSFPLAEVWLAPAKKPGDRSHGSRFRVYATLIGTGAVLGGLASWFLTMLLPG